MSSIKLISLDLDFARSNNKQIGIVVGNDTIDNVLSILPDNDNIRYIILSNGTLIYDIRKDQVVYDIAIGNDEVLNYLELVKKEEVLVQAITYNEIIQERKDDIDYFNMPEKSINKKIRYIDDIIAYLERNGDAVYQINIYHHTIIGCKRNRQRLTSLGLNVISSDKTTIECTKKTLGYKKICKMLKVDPEDIFVISDEALVNNNS